MTLVHRRHQNRILSVFFNQMAAVLDSGYSPGEALDILSRDKENKPLNRFSLKIKENLNQGKDASANLKGISCFNRTVINSVFGRGFQEKTAPVELYRLAEENEDIREVDSKIQLLFFMPAVNLIVAGVILSVLMVFVIPVFSEMYSSLGGELPVMTQTLINISDILIRYWIFLVIIFLVLIIIYRSNSPLKHWVVFKLPIIGDMMQKAMLVRFSGYVSSLMTVGCELNESLRIASESLGSGYFSGKISRALINAGGQDEMVDQLGATGLFPSVALWMMRSGLKKGSPADSFRKIKIMYKNDVHIFYAQNSTLMESFLIALIGSIIGYMVIALYLPIFSIAGAVG